MSEAANLIQLSNIAALGGANNMSQELANAPQSRYVILYQEDHQFVAGSDAGYAYYQLVIKL
jgi:hypothetical protein